MHDRENIPAIRTTSTLNIENKLMDLFENYEDLGAQLTQEKLISALFQKADVQDYHSKTESMVLSSYHTFKRSIDTD